MSARNPFAKFSLKPSSLSQHTVNFNKILEEVPAPKIESIILEKPKLAGVALEVKPAAVPKADDQLQTEKKEESEVASASSGFVFGESLTDRVINAKETAPEKTNGQHTNGNGTKCKEAADLADNKTSQLFNKQHDADTESKHVSDSLENDANTLIRMNCKLFVLDKDSKDQANWAERGYGILKMIECDEGENCKIMMWTDKCFRLVLNTKLFESMTIEKVNRKSIRLNAQDDGTIKMFLIKCGHPNECEELSYKMIYRLKTYKDRLASSTLSKKNLSTTSTSATKTETSVRNVVFESDCEARCLSDTNSTQTAAKLIIYTTTTTGNNSKAKSLFLDILNDDDQSSKIVSNRFLKSVKLNITNESTGDDLDFEVQQSFHVNYKVSIKTEITVKQFLDLYEQDTKESDDSNNSLNNSDSASETEESDSTSLKHERSENSPVASLESSVAEVNKSNLTENNGEDEDEEEDEDEDKEEEEEEEEETAVTSVSKKRRCEDDVEDEVQNENVKKMTLAETNTSDEQEEISTSLKRQASDNQSNSSQEEQFVKKSKSNESDESD